MKKKPVMIGIVFVLVFLGVIIYSTMNLSQNRVEVCITFKGRSLCRVASATTREFAVRTATANVCGELAGGVTETMACNQATPDSVKTLK
jgi:energy-converting hydrogenase Eha subunit H